MGGRLKSISFAVFTVVFAIAAALVATPFLIAISALMFVWDEISGSGRRLRRRRARMVERMVDGRHPLSDSDFLRAVEADESDAPLWLGVRERLADFLGVPAEAIHPDDPMSEIWWMYEEGPEDADIKFLLELTLGARIPRDVLESVSREMRKVDQEFAVFAGLAVRALRQVKDERGQP